mmetsp:Transcript_29286/g.43570  ORF Transcript_29286/g.43570 Transcript_29286/m.43570 type:complete len:354 (-) Transcript_29286:127-1188(-)
MLECHNLNINTPSGDIGNNIASNNDTKKKSRRKWKWRRPEKNEHIREIDGKKYTYNWKTKRWIIVRKKQNNGGATDNNCCSTSNTGKERNEIIREGIDSQFFTYESWREYCVEKGITLGEEWDMRPELEPRWCRQLKFFEEKGGNKWKHNCEPEFEIIRVGEPHNCNVMLQKIEIPERIWAKCNICSHSTQSHSGSVPMMKCKECNNWQCCMNCYGPLRYKLRDWMQTKKSLEVLPVSKKFQFAIPSDDELFIGSVPAAANTSHSDKYLMELHKIFRSIEKELERLDDVSPFCVPVQRCMSDDGCCGIPEHEEYAKLLAKLYKMQRCIAIGGDDGWPSWAGHFRIWTRGYNLY